MLGSGCYTCDVSCELLRLFCKTWRRSEVIPETFRDFLSSASILAARSTLTGAGESVKLGWILLSEELKLLLMTDWIYSHVFFFFVVVELCFSPESSFPDTAVCDLRGLWLPFEIMKFHFIVNHQLSTTVSTVTTHHHCYMAGLIIYESCLWLLCLLLI